MIPLTTPTVSIKSLHLEYKLWIYELNFCKEQLHLFESHLEQLLSIIPGELTGQVERFQNQFICQKEVIDILRHDLNVSEKQLAAFVKELSGLGLESIKMDNHGKLRERMFTFRKLFRDLKEDFRAFESEAYLVVH